MSVEASEPLSAVLDQLARPADERQPDWADVVDRARRARGDARRRRGRRLRRLAAVALIAALAVLVATPAVGVPRRIVNLFDPGTPPWTAEDETGSPAQRFDETTYDGFPWAVLVYHDGRGRICYGAQIGSRTEGKGVEYSCRDPEDLFRTRPGRPKKPIALWGPTTMQESSRSDFDPTKWDKMYFYGLAVPEIARLEVVMTDCSHRPVLLDAKRFEGNGVFLFTVPRKDLYANVWPHRLIARDERGRIVYDEAIPGLIAPDAGGDAPRAAKACR